MAKTSKTKARSRRRVAFFNEAAALTPYLAVHVGEEIFFVATGDAGVGRRLFATGWRSDMTALARAMDALGHFGLGPPARPLLVDVGANIGTTTVLALRRHGFTDAVALEPSPGNFRLLRINLAANGVDTRVRAIAAAASDSGGELPLDLEHANRGAHRIATPAGHGRPTESVVMVEALTLDELAARGTIEPDRVGLLWTDTQHHDANVLLGASSLIEAGVPIVTAIRVTGGRNDSPRPWDAPPEVKALVLDRIAAHYTDVIVLRPASPSEEGRTHPIGEIGVLVDSFEHDQDLLLVRRRR